MSQVLGYQTPFTLEFKLKAETALQTPWVGWIVSVEPQNTYVIGK